jgi:hypothetical protein
MRLLAIQWSVSLAQEAGLFRGGLLHVVEGDFAINLFISSHPGFRSF